jgi:hypothetical protein
MTLRVWDSDPFFVRHVSFGRVVDVHCFSCWAQQVIIMSSEKEVAASLPVGVRRSARHVCWAANGELVAAIVEFESEQAGFRTD